MSPEDFVGRQAEARVILTNVEHSHNSLAIGEAGGGKTALPRFIESVPGHGYRFIAAVAGPPPKPRVVVKPHSPPAWPRAVIALLMLTIVGILAYFLEQAEMP